MNTLQILDEQLVARVVAAVLRELGHGGEPEAPGLDPESWITDPDAKDKLYGKCSRSKYWSLMKYPDAPPGHRIGRTMIRKIGDHLRFIASFPSR